METSDLAAKKIPFSSDLLLGSRASNCEFKGIGFCIYFLWIFLSTTFHSFPCLLSLKMHISGCCCRTASIFVFWTWVLTAAQASQLSVLPLHVLHCLVLVPCSTCFLLWVGLIFLDHRAGRMIKTTCCSGLQENEAPFPSCDLLQAAMPRGILGDIKMIHRSHSLSFILTLTEGPRRINL